MKNASEVRLQQTKGIGPKRYTSILAKLQELHQTADDLFAMPASEIAAVFKLPKNVAQAILNSPQTIQLELTPVLPLKEAQQLTKKDIKILKQSGSDYPIRLIESGDPKIPHILYYWGNLELLNKPSVGFCGSRDASPESLEATADIAKQATALGWTVVSGHARGVDTAAHHAALENGGSTILVIPEGILNFRLRVELKTIAKPEQLLIISEFDPKARWSVANAMTRNRTIIGLSDAMILVEARMDGGTFEAGQATLRVGKPLFVAIYQKLAPNSQGNQYFVSKGAYPLTKNTDTNRADIESLKRLINDQRNGNKPIPSEAPLKQLTLLIR